MKKYYLAPFIFLVLYICTGCAGSRDSHDSGDAAGTASADILPQTVRDTDLLRNYVNSAIQEITPSEFDNYYRITYADGNGDGREDAFLVNDMDWSFNILMVTASETGFTHIDTGTAVAKYQNDISMEDGFLKIVQKTGGTGIQVEYMTLLIYTEGAFHTVLEGVELHRHEEIIIEDRYIDQKAVIEGPLNDFDYIVTTDANGELSLSRTRYTYDETTMSFQRTQIAGQ